MARAELASEPDTFQPTDDLMALDDLAITRNDDHCSPVNHSPKEDQHIVATRPDQTRKNKEERNNDQRDRLVDVVVPARFIRDRGGGIVSRAEVIRSLSLLEVRPWAWRPSRTETATPLPIGLDRHLGLLCLHASMVRAATRIRARPTDPLAAPSDSVIGLDRLVT